MDVPPTLLWEQAAEARALSDDDLERIIGYCQGLITKGGASAADYVQFVACQLEQSRRQRTRLTSTAF